MQDLFKQTIRSHFPSLSLREVNIILVHSGSHLLQFLPHSLRNKTYQFLNSKGISIRLNTKATQLYPSAIELEHYGFVSTKTVIWTTGVEGNTDMIDFQPINQRSQVLVRSTLQTLAHPDIFALGDAASIRDSSYPMLAQTAIQQAKIVAKNINRSRQGMSLKSFRYFHKGTMVVLGQYSAVVSIGPLQLTGIVAWIFWLALHLILVRGHFNRFAIIMQWLWGNLFGQRTSRLVFNQSERDQRKPTQTPTTLLSS